MPGLNLNSVHPKLVIQVLKQEHLLSPLFFFDQNLNDGKITVNDETYKILKNEKVMSDNRLELPFGFALHHLEE